MKLGKSLQTCLPIFFRLSWHFKREKPFFWKASLLQNKNWLIVYKTSRLVRISLLISNVNKEFFFFLEKAILSKQWKTFSRVCIAWYKHSRGWENSWQLCKSETTSRVCITVSNSPNPSSVYIRLCKHRKKVQAIYLWTWSFTVHKEMYRIYAN